MSLPPLVNPLFITAQADPVMREIIYAHWQYAHDHMAPLEVMSPQMQHVIWDGGTGGQTTGVNGADAFGAVAGAIGMGMSAMAGSGWGMAAATSAFAGAVSGAVSDAANSGAVAGAYGAAADSGNGW